MSVSISLIMRRDDLEGYQRTDRACNHCDNGVLHVQGAEAVCDSCYVVIDSDRPPKTVKSEWELFWEHRDEYEGFYGPDRVKMVGGFGRSYP